MADRVLLKIEHHIAQVVLNRPEKMNALDADMFSAIAEVGTQLNSHFQSGESIRAVVISGAGGNFCAGLDKSTFSGWLDQGDPTGSDLSPKLRARTRGIANDVQWASWLWRELPVPVIAAVQGVALGGGLQIALGADMRFATPDSQFSIMELKWGIVPDMSSTQIMRHLVRDDVIRELTYSARMFSAQEAQEYGFVTKICNDPLAEAMNLAQDIVNKNPQAIQAAKRLLDQANYQTQAEGLLAESVEQENIIGTPNQIEAVMAVLEKRRPDFVD